jgi:hypothetical protein
MTNVTYLDNDKSGPVEVYTTTSAGSYFSSTPFSCLHVDNHPKMLKESGSYVPNTINVYYVEGVEGENGEGGSDYGVVCSDHRDIIAIGRTTAATILAHELGHSFSLEHVDDYTKDCPSCTCDKPTCPFDHLNVMYSKGPLARETLTEGQVFRAFYNLDSVVNSIFRTGPGTGLDRPYCREEVEQPPTLTLIAKACPLLQKRLWPDDAMWGTAAWPTN